MEFSGRNEKFVLYAAVRQYLVDGLVDAALKKKLNAYIFAALNIKHAITSAYHPQSNGQDERTNQNVKRTLRKYVNQHHDDWDIHLQAIVYGINTAKQRSTKYSPYFLMYNRHPRLPQALNVCETDAAFELADPEEELELKLAGVKALNETAGDEVLIGEPKKKVKKGNCLQDLHQGPFTLTSLTEKGVASVAMLGKIQKLNVAQLRPYFRPQGHSHESAAEDIGLVDHQYANKGPLWSKRLCPQQEKVLTYVLDRTRPAKEIVVLDGPVCLQREDFWSLGLDEQVESNIGNACFRLVEEAARRHGMDVHIADLFEVPKWKLREPSLPDNVESKDIIILPAWSRGSQTASHYMLCVLLVAKKEAIFLDSLCPNGFGDEKYRTIFRQLAGAVANGPWVEKTGKDFDPFPVQSDGQSCGIFMLMYALCICTGAMFHFLDTDIPSIQKWWCLQILEKFSIARHGQNFGLRFAFWTEEAEQLMAGTLPPIYRISRPQIVKEEQVEVEELPLTLKHMYQAEYIVRNSLGLFTGQADETTDIATLAQLVLVLRYIDDKNNVQERFFEFIPLQSATAESIATALKERLASILPEDQKSKLICQAYDGASVMRGATAGDFDPNTVREAGALAMLLEDDDFKFFLELYHHIMPHVDFLYAKLQKKNIDSVHIKVSIQQFQQEIQKIRNSLHSIGEQSSGSQPTKRRRVLSPEERERIGAEVCDTILGHTRERFSFTDHLVCATLLQGDRFDEYKDTFPDDALSSTIRAYPMLNGSKLKTELSLIYSKQEFSACRGAVDLFQLFMENNLEENPSGSVLYELQLSYGLFGKASEESITIIHPAGDESMHKFL
ncbi:unnamed protein product [Leuciscus chuanchicus]